MYINTSFKIPTYINTIYNKFTKQNRVLQKEIFLFFFFSSKLRKIESHDPGFLSEILEKRATGVASR